MTRGVVHVVGAGLSGLASAVALVGAGATVRVHEAARFAGGRCRSYFEPSLGIAIDNGNHLLLSGNRATLAYLATLGAGDRLAGPQRAEYDFADLASGARWRLRINDGRLPWWICAPGRRAPGTRARDYLAGLRLMRARPEDTVAGVLAGAGNAYDRLWRPLLLAALNTDPREACAQLAGAVLRETLAHGGAACRPLIATGGLAAAFVDPALAWLRRRGASIAFEHRLRGLRCDQARVTALEFAAGDTVALGAVDHVVLAVPAPIAHDLLPDLVVPTEFRAIVNAHFKIAPPPSCARILGVINGLCEWLFAYEDRLSVTISAADRLLETSREELANRIWKEVASLTGLAGEAPPWQLIKERRATFACLPSQQAKRPHARTRWPNLVLAGDWTATGLPATIEGAIRSGNRAAQVVLAGARGARAA